MVWPLPLFIFVTDRVVPQLIRDNRLTGAVLKQPTDLDLSGGFGPGGFPIGCRAQRARELGAAMGIA